MEHIGFWLRISALAFIMCIAIRALLNYMPKGKLHGKSTKEKHDFFILLFSKVVLDFDSFIHGYEKLLPKEQKEYRDYVNTNRLKDVLRDVISDLPKDLTQEQKTKLIAETLVNASTPLIALYKICNLSKGMIKTVQDKGSGRHFEIAFREVPAPKEGEAIMYDGSKNSITNTGETTVFGGLLAAN